LSSVITTHVLRIDSRCATAHNQGDPSIRLVSCLSTDLVLGQGGEAQVGLDDAEVGEELLGLLVGDGGSDNDIVTGDPVDGGGDAVLVAGLEGVDDAEDLGGVAAGGGRVGEDGADLLVGVDEEDGADGEGNALLVDIGGVLVVDPVVGGSAKGRHSTYMKGWARAPRRNLHVVGEGDLALLVANDGEGNLAAGDLLNVVDPAIVGVDGVGGQANELDAALGELGLELSEGAELGGADGSVVLGVGEEDNPLVADELVEVNGAGRGLSLEVGGDGAETERSSLRHGGRDCILICCLVGAKSNVKATRVSRRRKTENFYRGGGGGKKEERVGQECEARELSWEQTLYLVRIGTKAAKK
jgi:hypothetical protein